MDDIRSHFTLLPGAEIAIEIDPTSLTPERLAALARMGVNRASLGVQDFDQQVQDAIGRQQSFEETQACTHALRGIGITSLNLDLIYGLPHQTEASLERTSRLALSLRADRVAVFGYAHVPWMKKHQSLIPEASLPGAQARFAQAKVVRRVLEREGGYVPVGLDHFARPGDAMADAALAKNLHRSFQGYTTDAAPVLIGLGASAIGSLPQGYVHCRHHQGPSGYQPWRCPECGRQASPRRDREHYVRAGSRLSGPGRGFWRRSGTTAGRRASLGGFPG
jgi:oxygen-independent coproporphyrinogen-3 oxidase